MKLTGEQLALLEHILWKFTNDVAETVEIADQAETIRKAVSQEYKDRYTALNHQERISRYYSVVGQH
jgi:hypothetical protein